MSKVSDEFIAGVILDISELSDRNSPSDAPDMMLVTGAELRTILTARLQAIGLREAEQRQLYKA